MSNEYVLKYIKNVRMWQLEGTETYFHVDYLRRVSDGYIRRLLKEETGIIIDDKRLGKMRNPNTDKIVLKEPEE